MEIPSPMTCRYAPELHYEIAPMTIEVDGNPSTLMIALERPMVGWSSPVGFGQLLPPDDEYPPLLCDLFVHEDHRRRGIGAAIVEMARGIVDGREDWQPLHVYYRPSGPGRALFQALGFVETGRTGVEDEENYIWARVGQDVGEEAST